MSRKSAVSGFSSVGAYSDEESDRNGRVENKTKKQTLSPEKVRRMSSKSSVSRWSSEAGHDMTADQFQLNESTTSLSTADVEAVPFSSPVKHIEKSSRSETRGAEEMMKSAKINRKIERLQKKLQSPLRMHQQPWSPKETRNDVSEGHHDERHAYQRSLSPLSRREFKARRSIERVEKRRSSFAHPLDRDRDRDHRHRHRMFSASPTKDSVTEPMLEELEEEMPRRYSSQASIGVNLESSFDTAAGPKRSMSQDSLASELQEMDGEDSEPMGFEGVEINENTSIEDSDKSYATINTPVDSIRRQIESISAATLESPVDLSETIESSIKLSSTMRSPHSQRRKKKVRKRSAEQKSISPNEELIKTPANARLKRKSSTSPKSTRIQSVRTSRSQASSTFTAGTPGTSLMMISPVSSVVSRSTTNLQTPTPSKGRSSDKHQRVAVDDSQDLVAYASTQKRKGTWIREGRERVITPKSAGGLTSDARRSRRTKWKPLAFWKGERILYTNNQVDNIEITGACKTQLCSSPKTPILAHHRKKRKRGMGRSLVPFKLPTELELEQADGDYEFYDTETMEMKTISFINERTQNWIKMKPRDLPNFEQTMKEFPPVLISDRDAARNAMEILTGESTGTVHNGHIRLPPKSQKPMEDTAYTKTTTFVVASCQPNALIFRSENSNQIVLPNTVIKVPSHTLFGFENASKEYPALLSYTLVQDDEDELDSELDE